MTIEIVKPRHQGLIVICTEIMPIFHDEQPLYRLPDLRDRRKHRVGKNVALHPGVNVIRGRISANAVQ